MPRPTHGRRIRREKKPVFPTTNLSRQLRTRDADICRAGKKEDES